MKARISRFDCPGNTLCATLYVQYRETDLAFLSRLCEHYGVAYYFDHQSGTDVMVFVDLNESYPEIIGGVEVPYRPRGEHHEIYRFEEKLRMIPAQYVVRDYNYRNPQLSLQGQSAFEDGKGTPIRIRLACEDARRSDANGASSGGGTNYFAARIRRFDRR